MKYDSNYNSDWQNKHKSINQSNYDLIITYQQNKNNKIIINSLIQIKRLLIVQILKINQQTI